MNNSLKIELQQYYKSISSALVCSSKEKKKFISEFQSEVNDYIESNPYCTLDDIKLSFGTSEEICRSFIENSSPTKLKKRTDIKKIIFIAIIIALLIWLAFAVISLIDVHEEAHGYTETVFLLINTFSEGKI